MEVIYNKENRKKVMALALFAGEIMLRNGAETYRVEDTVRRICVSRRLHHVSAFVTPTVIMLGDDRNDGYTFMKRIEKRSTNLERVSLANAISRDFVEERLTVEEAGLRLREISSQNSYSVKTRILWCGIASSMFAYLFGGGIADMLCGLLISSLATALSFVLDDWDMNQFLLHVVCSLMIACLAVLAYVSGLGKNLDMIIAASIMPLLPGFSLTNGIRDFIAGDLMSGSSRVFEALHIAVAIAISIGFVLGLFYRFGGLR